jgi:hypothetical protein
MGRCFFWFGGALLSTALAACGGSASSDGSGGTGAGGATGGSGGSVGGSGGTGATGGGVTGGSGGAGGSAGAGCPADISGAVGKACDQPGKLCGGDSCTDPCQFCNLIQCVNGKWEQLEAAPDPNCGDAGVTICGGLAGSVCATDEWCDYPDSAVACGGDDSTGVCMKKPGGCPTDCPGVCGCDGNFYCNACDASAAGVDIDPNVACASAGGTP